MKINLFAFTGFGNVALKTLLTFTNVKIIKLYTRKEKGIYPHYEEQQLDNLAEENNIVVKYIDNLSNWDIDDSADINLVVTFHRIFNQTHLSMAKHNINIHPSLLPSYKGPTPTNWMIHNNEKECGISMHLLNLEIDTGDIIYQKAYPLVQQDDSSLREFLASKVEEPIEYLISNFPNYEPIQSRYTSSVYPSYNRISQEIEKLLPYYTEVLKKLVKYNSVYGQEKEAQLYIKSEMQKLGLEPEVVYSRDDLESINLVSVIRGTANNTHNSLILNAHADVTPVDQVNTWDNDPFCAKIIDNKLYAKGAQDDKAGLAIMLLVYNVLKNLNIDLKGDLILESVIEDETTGNGSKCLVENGYTSDGVIIIDGTWSERIVYAHLGQVWLNIEIIGESVAACVEQRGTNPIYIGLNLITALRGWIDTLNSKAKSFEGIDNPFFINVGSFHSGVWAGSVPQDSKIEIQVGFNDEYTPQQIILEINEIAKDISKKIKISQGLLNTSSFKVEKDSLFINNLKDIIETNSKKEVRVVPVTGHCDMRHFKTNNCCLYGPGGGKNAHSNNEFYILDQMPIVSKNILDFILKWCNESRI